MQSCGLVALRVTQETAFNLWSKPTTRWQSRCLRRGTGVPAPHNIVRRFLSTPPTSGSVKNPVGFMGKIVAFADKRPLVVGTVIATIKTALADLLVQRAVEKKSWDEIDWRRNRAFLGFGFLYLGVGMYFVYVKGFRILFKGVDEFCRKPFRDKIRDRKGLVLLSKQVFADILIIQPFMFWPTYYTFKEFCFSPPSDTRKPGAIVVDALQKARMHSFADNVGMGAFWIPANYYIYALPMYLRLPVNHGVSFLWCCILSLWRGSKESAIANETVG
eukprot:m.1454166 g.1454166  ORF g.1454166 m.1454166 type:complete len:274 (-) comp25119_c0_seq2:2393-3214(-)